jgi:hypothetical protein
LCPECGEEFAFWDEAVSQADERVRKEFKCPGCSVDLSKTDLEPAQKTVFNAALGKSTRRAKQVPVLINYFVGQERYEKAPDDADVALFQRITGETCHYWFPTTRIGISTYGMNATIGSWGYIRLTLSSQPETYVR